MTATGFTVGTANALLPFFLRPNNVENRATHDQTNHTDDDPIHQIHTATARFLR